MSNLCWDFIFKDAAALKDTLTAVGILVGGWWTYARFIRARVEETALDIDLSYATAAYTANRWLIFLNVILKNQGKVKLRAREKTNMAYDHGSMDGKEHVYTYGLGLKIRKIPTGLTKNCWVDWYGDSGLEALLPEINLLKGYVKGEQRTDFWMEPGESYTLSAPVILEAGSYLAMATFIGSNEEDEEFWQRVFLIQVPGADSAIVAGNQSKDVPKQE